MLWDIFFGTPCMYFFFICICICISFSFVFVYVCIQHQYIQGLLHEIHIKSKIMFVLLLIYSNTTKWQAAEVFVLTLNRLSSYKLHLNSTTKHFSPHLSSYLSSYLSAYFSSYLSSNLSIQSPNIRKALLSLKAWTFFI